jgi:hypothetical protein
MNSTVKASAEVVELLNVSRLEVLKKKAKQK